MKQRNILYSFHAPFCIICALLSETEQEKLLLLFDYIHDRGTFLYKTPNFERCRYKLWMCDHNHNRDRGCSCDRAGLWLWLWLWL